MTQSADPPPLDHWTELERWVWSRTLAGEVADLHARYGAGLDPKSDGCWQSTDPPRRLTQRFLVDLLTIRAFDAAMTRRGVQIVGAWFAESLTLDGIDFGRPLSLTRCRFTGNVSFAKSRWRSDLELSQSHVTGDVTFERCVVDQELGFWKGSVDGGVVLNSARIGGDLRVDKGHVGTLAAESLELGGDFYAIEMTCKGDMNLRAARVRGQLNAPKAVFDGDLVMDGLDVAQDVFLNEGAKIAGGVVLIGAKVGGELNADGSTFGKEVDLTGIVIGQDVALNNKATFKEKLILRGARLGGVLNASDSTFEGPIDMRALDVAGEIRCGGSTFLQDVDMGNLRVKNDLVLGPRATFKGSVFIRGAHLGAMLNADGAIFESGLEMDALETARTLFLSGATLKGPVNILFARLPSLDLRGADIRGDVDVTGTIIAGELRMGVAAGIHSRWGTKARLVLRNTRVGAIENTEGTLADWPAQGNLELDGFSYDRLGGLQGTGRKSMAAREATWLVDWLSCDPSDSPQPYYQLARVLREAGKIEKSNAILYAAREHERAKAKGWAKFGRTLLKMTIGYGIGSGYFRALWWVLGFTLIGAAVLYSSGSNASDHGMAWCTWASFDEIIPLVQLNGAHAKFVDESLAGWRQWYFYVHRIVAYVLGSFVIAGLSGLTQKP